MKYYLNKYKIKIKIIFIFIKLLLFILIYKIDSYSNFQFSIKIIK